ncbi:hypothetical protein GYH30_053072 [Glycine max]|nr:hypothetical protein JHK87_053546 [Glycine soja]KAH1077846.1 hypothetical protein GYH30_053072 [Glycine max]
MIFLSYHLHEGLKTEYLTIKTLFSNIEKKGFKKYFGLISCLLVIEQNNEFLLKNHEARPIGSTPFPEVNMTTHDYYTDRNIDHIVGDESAKK